MLLQLLPFAIAGAFVPTWTSRVIILLATDRPLFNGFAFVAGNFAYRFILGIAALYILDTSTLNNLTESGKTTPVVFLVSAALLFSLAIWLWRQGVSGEEDLPGWMKALERVHPVLSFAYGALLVALPGVQYVYFLGAIGVLSSAGTNLATQVIGLAMFCALVQAMLLVPVVAFARYHDSAATRLATIKDWLAKNGSRVTAALLGMFGMYALVLGLLALSD